MHGNAELLYNPRFYEPVEELCENDQVQIVPIANSIGAIITIPFSRNSSTGSKHLSLHCLQRDM